MTLWNFASVNSRQVVLVFLNSLRIGMKNTKSHKNLSYSHHYEQITIDNQSGRVRVHVCQLWVYVSMYWGCTCKIPKNRWMWEFSTQSVYHLQAVRIIHKLLLTKIICEWVHLCVCVFWDVNCDVLNRTGFSGILVEICLFSIAKFISLLNIHCSNLFERKHRLNRNTSTHRPCFLKLCNDEQCGLRAKEKRDINKHIRIYYTCVFVSRDGNVWKIR